MVLHVAPLEQTEAARGSWAVETDALGAIVTTRGRRCAYIRLRIVLPLAVLGLVALLVAVAAVHRTQVQLHDRHLTDRATLLAHSISFGAQTAIVLKSFQAWVGRLADEPGVQMLVVTAGDPPRVIAGSTPEWLGLPVGQLPPEVRDCLAHTGSAGANGAVRRYECGATLTWSVPVDVLPVLAGGSQGTAGTLLVRLDDTATGLPPITPLPPMVIAVLATVAVATVAVDSLLKRVVLEPAQAIEHHVTRLKQVEDELTRAARLDKLTGLPNRSLFLDRLQHAITRAHRAPDHTYAVMFLDFDRFKIINDSLGHNVGDALLVAIAQRLRDNVRAVDSVSAHTEGHTHARLGGDEFVVLLDDIQTVEEATAVAERLLETLAKPYMLGKHEVYSTASIGIVVGDLSYELAEDVIRDADTAMYESKRLGRCRYTVFDASMRERVQRRHRLENELRRAIGTPQLSLTYQPVVSVSNGEFVAVEALMRWRHPADGLVDASEFIALAEESDLIVMLGEWALREACRQFMQWQEELGTMAPHKVSINVSRRQFNQHDLPELVDRVLRATGIPPACVQLELTEDTFVSDIRAAVEAMRAIKQLGVELAIAGFGTGTSSFASLHEFPVDVLKIHRSMLNGIDASKDVASLIHGLAVMVKNMGIDMVAEGVETPAQLIALQELGCEYAQGFLFARPLTPDEVRTFASRSVGMTCSTRGAAAYAHQWNERLTVFHDMGPISGAQ